METGDIASLKALNIELIADAVIFVGVLLLFRAWYLTWSLKQRRPWPVVPGAWPLIGNYLGPGGISSFARRTREWAAEYGCQTGDGKSNPAGVVECVIFGTRYLIVCNNELAARIFNQRPFKIIKNTRIADAAESMGLKGVFTAEGSTWSHDRRIMGPALNMKNVQDYLPYVQAVTARLIKKWKNDAAENSRCTYYDQVNQVVGNQTPSGIVTINRDLVCFAIDNTGLIAFGKDYDSLRRPDSQEAKDVEFGFRQLFARALSPIGYWKIPLIGDYLDGAARVKNRLCKSFDEMIEQEEARQEAVKNGSVDEAISRSVPTLLSKLVSACNNGGQMPRQRVRGNLQTMFSAGGDTTAIALMVCLYRLAADKSGLQVELENEALAMPELESNPDLTVDDLMNGLPKLRSLFYEVVRASGPAPGMMVQTTQDFALAPGIVVPPGTRFILPLQYLGTLPGSGIPTGPSKTPIDEFCARRWRIHDESGMVIGVVKPSAKTGVRLSTGFGGGPRICPGQHLAEVEAIFCLAAILRAFHVTIPEDHPPIQMISRLTAAPDVDIRLVLKPR